VHDQPAEAEQADDSDQVYDQLAESASASQTEPQPSHDENPQVDISAHAHVDIEGGEGAGSMDYPEGEIESAGDAELPIEDHRIPDQKDERRQSNGEAWRRLGSSILR
jgi:hypothetical protein